MNHPTPLLSTVPAPALEALWQRCRQRLPTLSTPATLLWLALELQLQHVKPAELSAQAWLERLLIEDLYLALSCLDHDAVAMQLFHDTYGSQLHGLALRSASSDAHAEDLEQTLMLSLFVDSPRRQAKLRSYTGQGALRVWLQITATRTFIDITRANAARQEELPLEDELLELLTSDLEDIELEYFQQTYRVPFKEAFAQAVAELSPRQRNLLAQHILHQLTIDQLGAIYNVHRSTAARWLDDARQLLAKRTRKLLGQRLNLQDSELDSIMRLVQSRVSLSLSRLLGPSSNP